jgi:hypothetical protein
MSRPFEKLEREIKRREVLDNIDEIVRIVLWGLPIAIIIVQIIMTLR